MPEINPGFSTANQIETQRRMATESKELNQKMMQDYQFQVQGFKNNFKTITP